MASEFYIFFFFRGWNLSAEIILLESDKIIRAVKKFLEIFKVAIIYSRFKLEIIGKIKSKVLYSIHCQYLLFFISLFIAFYYLSYL